MNALLLVAVMTQTLTQTQELFTTPLSLEQMQGKQAVFETTMGEFVIEFLPEKAPNHVGYFMKLIEEGAFEATAFHRLIKYGIVQGGDPKTKDKAATAEYGTGGLGFLARELSDEKHTRGPSPPCRSPESRTAPARSFSSWSPTSPRSTGNTRCSLVSFKAST